MAKSVDVRQLFGRNVRRWRTERGLTQEELAYKARVSRAHLSQIEHGATHASLRLLSAFASVLNVEPHELLISPTLPDGNI